MGTGSHRAQLESARGKRDRVNGIVHARSLKSHSTLKFRKEVVYKESKRPAQIESAENDTIEKSKDDVNENKPASGARDPVVESDSKIKSETVSVKDQEDQEDQDQYSDDLEEEEEEDDSDSEDELKRELVKLQSKQRLREQKHIKSSHVSGWRKEHPFAKFS
ncbi:hypothetical protein DASB73_030330 [Starmerella bacillaris]|uniref:Uncharacterized protein n=1 Tax=Starmerella bacillaris TaxID=1247836 RepID=A0AAV5RKZ6_STABA|nr:hypothetical protein DASB73_030330 [Starmerella bacillaris]